MLMVSHAKKFLFSILIITLILIIFCGCQNNLVEQSEIVDVGNLVSNARWHWFDLAIGESSKDDLLSTLGTPEIQNELYYQDQAIGNIYLYPQEPGQALSIFSRYIQFYIINELIVAVSFNSTEIPFGGDVTLRDLFDEYGYPDLIGYNRGAANSRILVWLDEGFQADVGLKYSSDIGTLLPLDRAQIRAITYFFPIAEDDYLNTFLSNDYSMEKPVGDDLDLFPADTFQWE